MNKTPSFAADASHRLLGDKQRKPAPNWLLGVLFSDKNTDGSSNIFCQTNEMLAAVQMMEISMPFWEDLWELCGLQFKMVLDYWAQEAVPLLCCWFASHLLKRVCIQYVWARSFFGQKVWEEECCLWNSPSCLTWLLNWGRSMSCRKLQIISRQWQCLPEAPTTSLQGRAGLGLQLCLRVMGSDWLSSFNSLIFRLLSRLHKSTAAIQKLHVKSLQAVWVLRTNIWLPL